MPPHPTPERLAAATADLTATVLRATDGMAEGDQQAPSRCAGWTRGHVLTHLARNADGLGRMIRACVDGSGETMYPSAAAREAEIDAGATRPLGRIREDLAGSCDALATQLARLAPEHDEIRVERVPGGPTFRAGSIPFLRVRELAYHLVDLDLGHHFRDLDPELVRAFLADEVARLADGREPPAMTLVADDGQSFELGEGGGVVSGPAAGLLAWLARGLTSDVRGDLPTLPHGG